MAEGATQLASRPAERRGADQTSAFEIVRIELLTVHTWHELDPRPGTTGPFSEGCQAFCAARETDHRSVQALNPAVSSRPLHVLHLLAEDPVIFHLFALELKAMWDRMQAEPQRRWAELLPRAFAGSWRHRALEALLPVFT